MKTENNIMYVRINENYTATVRDLQAFRKHLYRETETFDKTFGEITYTKSTTSLRFVSYVKRMIRDKRQSMLPRVLQMIGCTGTLYANQGQRDYTIVSACEETNTMLLEYEMPSGTTALRVFSNNADEYNNFSYRQLNKSDRFKKHLNEDLLINNPQSGQAYVCS